MEDVWRGEAQDLLTQIAQLQEENKQLMSNLSHKDLNLTEEEFQKHEGKFNSWNCVIAVFFKSDSWSKMRVVSTVSIAVYSFLDRLGRSEGRICD